MENKRSSLATIVITLLVIAGFACWGVGFYLGSILSVTDPDMAEQYRTIGQSLGGAGLFCFCIAWLAA